jgi:hypothetical protein
MLPQSWTGGMENHRETFLLLKTATVAGRVRADNTEL